MSENDPTPLYAICLDDTGCPVSLVVRSVYRVLPDPRAEAAGMIRVVDESGGDYLYPAEAFAPIDLPAEARSPFRSGV